MTGVFQLFVQQQSQMDAKRLCGSLMATRLASPFFILSLGEPQPLRPALCRCWVLSRPAPASRPAVKAEPGQACILETGQAQGPLAAPRALGFCPSSG